MGSENPGDEGSEVPPADSEKAPEVDVEEPVTEPSEEPSTEEQYEELVEPEKPSKPRKKRKHLGAIITVAVILIILLVWTILSPGIMPVEGDLYINSSTYANLGSFNQTLSSWAATTNWGVSVSGPSNVSANQTLTFLVLISKVSEKPSNFWFRGTAITITNMTIIDSESGRILTTMANKSDLGYGKLATLKLSFASPGSYALSVTGQFLVYVDMRIGFLPVEKINLEPFKLTKDVVVS